MNKWTLTRDEEENLWILQRRIGLEGPRTTWSAHAMSLEMCKGLEILVREVNESNRRVREMGHVLAEAYQALASMASDLGVTDDEKVKKLLDNLSAQERQHQDVLPFPSFEKAASRDDTEHLLASPANAKVLMEAVERCRLDRHTDDDAVDKFAQAMKEKLAAARRKGRQGWETCDPVNLTHMLRAHVEKGDPLDVANFCMFLWSLGKPIGAGPEDRVARLSYVAELEARIQGLVQDLDAVDAARRALQEELARRRKTEEGVVWYWQGDGDDHLESLTCDVVIGAEALRGLLEPRDEALRKIREIASAPLHPAWSSDGAVHGSRFRIREICEQVLP